MECILKVTLCKLKYTGKIFYIELDVWEVMLVCLVYGCTRCSKILHMQLKQLFALLKKTAF